MENKADESTTGDGGCNEGEHSKAMVAATKEMSRQLEERESDTGAMGRRDKAAPPRRTTGVMEQ